MPYEIILQGKEATMLHGKFRFAAFWPELSMGAFMKIVSTPDWGFYGGTYSVTLPNYQLSIFGTSFKHDF